ncbi:MAG: hypothetical protein ACE5F7_04945 [Nitrospiria bacterium]
MVKLALLFSSSPEHPGTKTKTKINKTINAMQGRACVSVLRLYWELLNGFCIL